MNGVWRSCARFLRELWMSDATAASVWRRCPGLQLVGRGLGLREMLKASIKDDSQRTLQPTQM